MSRAGKQAQLRHRIGETAGSLPSMRCDRPGCREFVVPADAFTSGQLVGWRADGSPSPSRLDLRRRRHLAELLVARIRR